MYLFVINASSGNGRGQRTWRKIKPLLLRDHIPHLSLMLSDEYAMEELSRHIQNQDKAWKAVIIVGGDGTVHSLLPLFIDSGIPVGLIPAGSGNDTARQLGIPLKPQAALKRMLQGTTISLDLIETTSSSHTGTGYTLTAVATGFDGKIAQTVDQSFYKRWCNRLGIGSFAYIIALLQTLASFRPFNAIVTVDGKQHRFDNSWLIAVANTASYGGGLAICPSASPHDGILNICIVHSCTPLKLLQLFPTILFGKHTGLRYVTMLTGRDIEIQANGTEDIPSYGDGERLGSPPLHVKLVPQAFNMIQ